jgi:Tfp pilus assembly protein PilF
MKTGFVVMSDMRIENNEARKQRKRGRKPSAPRQRAAATRQAPTRKFRGQLDSAKRHEDTGDLAQARFIYRQILQDSATQPRANLRLATILHDQGEFAEAADYWVAATKAHPRDPFVRFNYGTCLQQLGRHSEAIYQYEDGLKIA